MSLVMRGDRVWQQNEWELQTGESPVSTLFFLKRLLPGGGVDDFFEVGSGRGTGGSGDEEIVVVEVAIHASGNFGGFGAEGGTATLQEDDGHDASCIGVGIGGEPSKASAGAGTGSGFAEDRFFAEVEAETARGAILDRSGHAIGKFGNGRGNVEMAFDDGLKIGNRVGGGGMLQVVQRG